MADVKATSLKLTDQKATADSVDFEFKKLKKALDDRKELWTKCPPEKRRAWIKSEKDPVINLAWDIYKYLDKNFFEGVK